LDKPEFSWTTSTLYWQKQLTFR